MESLKFLLINSQFPQKTFIFNKMHSFQKHDNTYINWDFISLDFIERLSFHRKFLEDQRNSLIYFNNDSIYSKNTDFIRIQHEKFMFYMKIMGNLNLLNSHCFINNIIIAIISDFYINCKFQPNFQYVYLARNTKKILENLV